MKSSFSRSRIFAVAIFLGFATAANCATTTVSYQVSANSDDGYAWSATEQDITAAHLIIGDDKTYYPPYHISAMRFTGLSVPRSAAIVDARLKIRSLSEEFRGQVYGVIQTESADDVNDFSSRYLASAAMSAASVDWDHKDTWIQNTWQASPDISGPVQEVVSRPGWSSANAIAVFYITRLRSGKRRLYASVDLSAAYAPVLEITYQTYAISGHVRTSGGAPIGGAIISAGSDIEETVTDGSGYYELSVPPGWSGTVTPSKADWGFDPPNRVYSNIAADQNDQDYTAFQPKISGYVTDRDGAGVEGVTASADNGGGSDTTDANGYYEITVPYNWSGIVTAKKAGWAVQPDARSYENIVSDLGGQNYTAAFTALILVRQDGTGHFTQIQPAIDVADEGYQIIVGQGTYHENVVFRGASITLISTDPDNANVVENTVISAAGQSSVVTFTGSENASCLLSGFTITGGDTQQTNGGGINGNWGNATITKCVVTGNRTSKDGGGIAVCEGLVKGCLVSDNNANRGGGLAGCDNVEDCIIINNSAWMGGGIFGGWAVSRCIIRGNTAVSGGGVCATRALISCVVDDNTAEYGGGLSHCSNLVINCTIVNNYAKKGGGLDSCEGTIKNCIIRGNRAMYISTAQLWYCSTPSYSCIQDWSSGGTGNISANPLFLADGYHISADSPCIDAGEPVYSLDANGTDIDNAPRVINGRVDMGADEFTDGSSIMALSESSLSFTALQDRANPEPQIFSVRNLGVGELDWTITVDCLWLWTEPVSGTTSHNVISNVSVEPDINDLLPGTYSCTLTVSDPNANGSPQSVNVDLTVIGPILSILPGNFNFIATHENRSPSSQVLSIFNEGGGTFDWQVSVPNDCNWLSVSPVEGTTAAEIDDVTLSVDASGLSYGTHIVNLTVTAPNSTNRIQEAVVHLEVDGPVISLSPSDFSFSSTLTNPSPPSQILQISNSGVDTLHWQIDVPNDCNWLTAMPMSGQATTQVDEVALSADASELNFGFYTCEITVSDPNAENHSQQFNVSLQVDWPIISVSPGEFNFTAATNDPCAPRQILNISNSGVDTLDWHITIPSDCNWLSVDPVSGECSGDVNEVTLSVDATGLPAGSYGCDLTVSDPNAENNPQTVHIDLRVDGPIISTAPATFEFRKYIDGPAPSAQILQISNDGVDVLNWQITIPPGCDWLNVYPLTGQSTGDINEAVLSADVNGLEQGFYICDLTIADWKAENTPQTVQVTLRVMLSEGKLYVPTEFPTIQDAVDAALDGDEVIVEPGTYTGPGNNDVSIFEKGLTIRSVDPNDPTVVAATVIDCNYEGEGLYFEGGYEVEPNSVLAGLTITKACGGYYSGAVRSWLTNILIRNCVIIDNCGHGISFDSRYYYESIAKLNVLGCTISDNNGAGIRYSGGHVTIADCTIKRNLGSWRGGGITCEDRKYAAISLSIMGCLITDNTGWDGGGLYMGGYEFRGPYPPGNTTVVQDCTIARNHAFYNGGGICIGGGPTRIINCNIIGNSADEDGGGVSASWAEPNMINCLVSGNKATRGGGLSGYGGLFKIACCTFAGNTADYGNTVALDGYGDGGVQMLNSIVWDGGEQIFNDDGSPISVSYSTVLGGYEGLGNIDLDPCFAVPGYWHPNSTPDDANDDFWVDGDYHLKSRAGRWSPSIFSQLDPSADGFINLTDFAAFAACWKEQGSLLPADLDYSGTVDFNDLALLLDAYLADYSPGTWVLDDVTSPAIDAGNPGCPLADEPNDPNNLRINMGAYGGTAEASNTPPDWALLADLTNDLIVDFNDVSVFVDYWLETGQCLPSDLSRSELVDFVDFALLADEWPWEP